MVLFGHRPARWWGLTAGAAATGAALLVGVIPSRGQGTPPPAVTVPVCRITHIGEVPRRGVTGVTVEFMVPPELTVHQPPRLRVTDVQGNVIALTPMFVQEWGPPVARAYRDLPTGIYPAGNHQLTAEFDHRDGRGQIGRAVSATATVTGHRPPRQP